MQASLVAAAAARIAAAAATTVATAAATAAAAAIGRASVVAGIRFTSVAVFLPEFQFGLGTVGRQNQHSGHGQSGQDEPSKHGENSFLLAYVFQPERSTTMSVVYSFHELSSAWSG
jgi:hypothetical protein